MSRSRTPTPTPPPPPPPTPTAGGLLFRLQFRLQALAFPRHGLGPIYYPELFDRFLTRLFHLLYARHESVPELSLLGATKGTCQCLCGDRETRW